MLPISRFWTSPLLLKVTVLSFRSPRKLWHSSRSKGADPIWVHNGSKACRSIKQARFQVTTGPSVWWEDGKAGGGWRVCSAKVTFCSMPCQPEGSALSGAKPTCSRVNWEAKIIPGKINLQLQERQHSESQWYFLLAQGKASFQHQRRTVG